MEDTRTLAFLASAVDPRTAFYEEHAMSSPRGRHRRALASAASLVIAWLSGGCLAAEEPVGPSLHVEIAALALPGVVDACYGVEVLNEALETVWTRSPICASQFGGGGGAISYVGTCDASDPNDDGVAEATVALTIVALYGPDGPDDGSEPDLLSDWLNPCVAPHAPGGCRARAACREGADVPVVFDVTVARRADQGFFDVAVSFADIFCSAKVDCAYPATETAPARPIDLVFDPATGERVQTVVWAFACTDGDPGGADAAATHLYMDSVVLTCGGTPYAVDPAADPGNVYAGGAGSPPPIAQAMVFTGREVVTNGDEDADALYWNVALGLRASYFAPAVGVPPDCVLTTRATASRGPLAGGVTPDGASYPYVSVSVPISVGGEIACSQHPLDAAAPHAGVATRYTGLDVAAAFAYVGAGDGGGFATGPAGSLSGACAANPGACSANAACTDLQVGYSCACLAGYSGDGVTCADVDECAAGTPCAAPRVCVNAVGSYACSCPSGTLDDGAGGCAEPPAGYVLVPAGTYTMGSASSLETAHSVTLTRAFLMGITEVTGGAYLATLGGNPSSSAGAVDAGDRPAESLTWYSALAYANKRSTNAGLATCYSLTGCTGTAAAGTLTCSGVTFAGLDCPGYRLPTEAEWEYAARKGTATELYGALDAIAWYIGNAGGASHAVATKAVSPIGLYDIIGNVWEWTWDWHAAYTGAATDPLGPATGTTKVLRGGSFANSSSYNRAAYRLDTKAPTARQDHLGFRVVRTAP